MFREDHFYYLISLLLVVIDYSRAESATTRLLSTDDHNFNNHDFNKLDRRHKVRSKAPKPTNAPISKPVISAIATESEFCPKGRWWSLPSKYYISPVGNALNEVSYMAFSSQTYKGYSVAYIASDKQQTTLRAVYFHKDLTSGNFIGSLLASFDLDFGTITDGEGDWESISMGPCDSTSDLQCIYIGSTGNNLAQDCLGNPCDSGRSVVEIYKIQEPKLESLSPGDRFISKSITIQLSYKAAFPAANNDGKANSLLD